MEGAYRNVRVEMIVAQEATPIPADRIDQDAKAVRSRPLKRNDEDVRHRLECEAVRHENREGQDRV